MAKSRAIQVFGWPAATLLFSSATCSLLSALFRPRYAPRFLASAIPSRCRYPDHTTRSNSAKAPMTESLRFAIGELSAPKVRPFFCTMKKLLRVQITALVSARNPHPESFRDFGFVVYPDLSGHRPPCTSTAHNAFLQAPS